MSAVIPSVVTDDAGHLWEPRVDAEVVRFAREHLRLDLQREAARNPVKIIDRLTRDPATIGALLFASVAAQAAEQGVSPEAFARLVRGKDGAYRVLEELVLAFVGSLADYFPDSRIGRYVSGGQFRPRSS